MSTDYPYAYDDSYHGNENDYYVILTTFAPFVQHYCINNIECTAYSLLEECLAKYRPSLDMIHPNNISQDQKSHHWYRHVNNHPPVDLGLLELNYLVLVNTHDDWSFEHLLCSLKNKQGVFRFVFDYQELIKGNISYQFERLQFNPSDPKRKYFTELFYHVLLNSNKVFILNIPSAAGWQPLYNKTRYFSASYLIHPDLKRYYPSCVQERHVFFPIDGHFRSISEIVSDYQKALPQYWKYKLLVTIRVASLFMWFFSNMNVDPMNIFLIQPASESNVALITTLLQTQNYRSQNICSLSNKPNYIRNELKKVNDGTVLFRDGFLFDNPKTLASRLEILLNDIRKTDESDPFSRHIIAIISNNPTSYPSEFPALLLQFEKDEPKADILRLRQLSGEFDRALIMLFEKLPYDHCHGIFSTYYEQFKSIQLSVPLDHQNLFFFVCCFSVLLLSVKLLTTIDFVEIINYFLNEKTSFRDASLVILNEFSSRLNEMIHSDELMLSPQFSYPYYRNDGHTAFFDDEYLNMEGNCVDNILSKMQTTSKKMKLFSILKNCSELYAKSSGTYTRTVKVATSPNQKENISVHSISLDLLDSISLDILNDQKYCEYYLDKQMSLNGLIPYLHNQRKTKICGSLQLPNQKENYHMFVCGKSGFGKSYFLLQQGLFHFHNGDRVFIFDQNDAFAESELLNSHRLPKQLFADAFLLFDLQSVMPVNIFNLTKYSNPIDAEEKLFALLSAIVNDMGPVQESTLTSIIHKIVTELGIGKVYNPEQMLEYMITDDNTQKPFVQRIRNVLEAITKLNCLERSWEQLFESKRIVVFSSGNKTARQRNYLFDMMLASIYSYKCSHEDKRCFLIIDELQKQNMSLNAPIDMIIHEGRKHNLFMLLATQNYPKSKSSMKQIIGNAATKVYFRQTDESMNEIHSRVIDKAMLTELKTGECIIEGNLFHLQQDANVFCTLKGRSADISDCPFFTSSYPELVQEREKTQTIEEQIEEMNADGLIKVVPEDLLSDSPVLKFMKSQLSQKPVDTITSQELDLLFSE